MLILTFCPEPDCDAPAEIVDEFRLASTDGPNRHVKTRCLFGHWFLLPADRLAEPADRPALKDLQPGTR